MTSISKNMYIDKLDDIVYKYNNTYQSSIKMKPVDVKSSTLILLKNIPILKTFLQKVTLQTVLKKFLWLKKLKIMWPGLILLTILMVKKLLELFTKKELQKTIQKNLELKK